MTEPSDAGQPQGDAQKLDVGATPIDAPTGGEQASDRDAAIAAVDEMVAAEQGDDDDDDESSDDEGGEQDDSDDSGGDDDSASDDEDEDDSDDSSDQDDADADDDAKPPKLSARVREAHRRQRAAERKLQKAHDVESRNEDRGKALDARDQEWTTFETELKRNPLQAIAVRMGITVPRLIAAYGEDAQKDVPEAVSLEMDALRKELQEFRDEGKAAGEKLDKDKKDARYNKALDNDAKLLAGMVADDKVADRYPYYAALPDDQRASKARALSDYIVKHMSNPGQYGEDDFLEALDAKEKDRITKLEKAGVIKWLGRKKKAKDDDDDADESNGNSKRPRTPSARKAASAAPKYKDMTVKQLRKAAADEIDRLRAAAD